jgi:ADP-ribose pyrophosphatase
MREKKFKILGKELIHSGFCHLEKFTLQNKLFSGAWSMPYTRELLIKPRVAAALPYDPVLDRVILIEQFRVGAFEDEDSPWLLEVVAGIMDRDSETSLEQLIRRELQEEAGVEARELLHICDYWVSPGASTEKVKLFCAKVDSTKAPAFCGISEENEDIKVHVLPREEAFVWLQNGKIKNSAAIIAIQWLALNWEKIIVKCE